MTTDRLSSTPICTPLEPWPTRPWDKLQSSASSVPNVRFSFVVPGQPVAWARAGLHGKRHFTPQMQRNYMRTLQLFCQVAMRAGGHKPIEGPVHLEVVARYPWPKDRKRHDSAWKLGRPDFDNIVKIVSDALIGVAWVDDAQVCDASVQKYYNAVPGLLVVVEALR